MEINTKEVYQLMFKEYPDILDVKQVSNLLGVSTKTVYRLLRAGSLSSLKVGREFRIPKVYVLRYLKVLDCGEISAKA
jgi:excisionase family DNA binding protein